MATAWTYSEYVNVACTHYSDYHNYNNICSNTYANYANGSYRNHSDGGSATYHHNYANGAYIQYTNSYSCSVYSDHHDHVNYTLTDKGTAKTLTWSSPWGGVAGARTLDEDYITNSVDAIKQLRDNIRGAATDLTDKLSYNTTIASTEDVPDADFGVDKYVLPPTNNDLKSNLDSLWAVIRGDDDASTPGQATKARGDLINKSDMENLASKTDQLAAYVDPNYLNHVDYANGLTPGYAGPPS